MDDPRRPRHSNTAAMSGTYDSETASEEDEILLTPQVKRKSQSLSLKDESETESDEELPKLKRYNGCP